MLIGIDMRGRVRGSGRGARLKRFNFGREIRDGKLDKESRGTEESEGRARECTVDRKRRSSRKLGDVGVVIVIFLILDL